MDVRTLIDIVRHLDRYLDGWSASLGPWLYVVLFVVVFCETGLVVTPFLPGDSLLFACGVLAARPASGVSVVAILAVLFFAAVFGDAANYAIGRRIGQGIVARKPRWLNLKHIERTQEFYAKHGGKTIVLARFVPIVRTFAPFVAGMGNMGYRRFATFNVAGAFVWVVGLVMLGHEFADTDYVKSHFEQVVMAIIFISVLPMVFEMVRARRAAKQPPEKQPETT